MVRVFAWYANSPNNNITEIPNSFTKLRQLKRLKLDSNPIVNQFFYELKDLDAQKLISYLLLIKNEGGKPLNEAKILVVGDERVGKSSIIKRLVSKTFNENEISTEGIEICSLYLNNSIKANIWDFAGQEITHQTHQFFLSNRSLYLFVLDAQKEDNDSSIYDWLETINQNSKDSPIVILINKYDLNPGYEFDINRYKSIFSNIVDVQYVSAKDNENIDLLLQSMDDIISKLHNVKNILPQSWFNVKVELETMSSSKQDIIESAIYEQICEKYGIFESTHQLELLNTLHEIGTIVKYQNSSLNNIQILNPLWVTNAVYKIIRSTFLEDKAILTKKGFYKIFMGDKRYKERHYEWIINLLVQFELAFKIDEDRILIPIKLPPNQPYQISSLLSGVNPFSLQLRYKYSGKLKKTHISHFIVKAHRYIKKNTNIESYWKRGVVLYRGYSTAIVISDENKKEINVKIFTEGNDAREFMATIRDIFSELNGNIEVSEQIPLMKNKEIIGYEDYEYLKSLEKSAKYKEEMPLKIDNGKRHEVFNLSTLLDGYKEPAEKEFNYEQLIKDIVIISLYETKNRNNIYKESENETNDRFRNALYYTGYLVADQTRAGDSESGKSVGERDIVVNDKQGIEQIVIEAFILKYNDNNNGEFAYQANTLTKN